MITIENSDGRLSAWGKQADVKWIYWLKLPKNLPRAGGTLDLTGSIIEAEFKDGTTATVTQYCTFSPAEGTSIPLTAKNITVTAFYPARSGKTFEAPATLPVIHPVGLRIVTDPSYKPKENFYNSASAQFDPTTMPLDTTKIKTYVLYAQDETDEVIFAEKCEDLNITPSYSYQPAGAVGTPPKYGIGGVPDLVEDVEVYHNVSIPSVETFEYAIKVTASATVEGSLFTAETYIDSVPIVALLYDDFPTVSGQGYTFYGSGILFKYADGSVIKPVAGLNDYGLSFSFNEPSALSWHNPMNVSAAVFQDGNEGDFYIIRYNTIGAPAYSFTKWHYVCTDGTIEWTQEDS